MGLSQCHKCWEEDEIEWSAVEKVLEEPGEEMILLGLSHHFLSYRQLNIAGTNVVDEDKVSPHGK